MTLLPDCQDTTWPEAYQHCPWLREHNPEHSRVNASCRGLRAAEAGGQHIHLGGLGARRLRLHVTHLGKGAVEARDQLLAGAPLKGLSQEGAARRQNVLGEIERGLDQS